MTLSLFEDAADPQINLLPCDGIVNDHGTVFAAEADAMLAWLLAEVPWQHDEVQLYGKRIVTARRVAWYGDEAFDYRYSGVNHRARLWAPPLRTLRDQVSARVGVSFNSCLLNRYDDGTQGPVSLPRALWRYTVASIFFWGGLALVWTAGSAFTAVLWALLWLLPFGWSLFDRRRRTLYDVLAGTVLVRHDAMAGRRGQKPAPR